MRSRLLWFVVAVGLASSTGLASALPLKTNRVPTLPIKAQERSVDPVVLTGAQFPAWSAGPEVSFREPQVPTDYDVADVQGKLPAQLRSDCYDPRQNPYDPGDTGDHNCNQSSRIPFRALPGRKGADVKRLLGYRWTGSGFVQIPLQVDERFTRYLTNNTSGFAFYSGVDQYTTYAFDREGYRFTDNDPANPCQPIARKDPHYGGARITTEPDPIPGLDDNDEIAFMYRDTGPKAPLGVSLPAGIKAGNEVAIADPSNPRRVRYAYVMLAGAAGPQPAFDTSNGYVRYEPDANARNVFVYSQSSYGGYGAAPKGPYCNPDGTPSTAHGAVAQRRPLDTAWIRTPRYAFRYDGRWLMSQIRVSNDAAGDWNYGPDVIDRWKARAFQQDPSSNTPCCGYEEEDTNWGGSSILLGERSGPVRTIRETWGSDSATNNVRRETFYRDAIVWGDALRVHPIPPLDGIYTQWDYNAGRMTRYYNPWRPKGVSVDGQNDEVFGNLDDPCNARYDAMAKGTTKTYRDTYKAAGLCGAVEYHQSVDVTDPTLSVPSNALQWGEVSGPYGSLVTRYALRDVTPGGVANTVVAVPYYRDDSCFDDGTGTDPGPRRRERQDVELTTYRLPGDPTDIPRTCWKPSDGLPDENFVAGTQPYNPGSQTGPTIGDEFGDERYFQGDIGASGVHLLLVGDSDNAQLTVPTTEIDSEQRVVVLPGEQQNVGERYGRSVEYPLRTLVHPL